MDIVVFFDLSAIFFSLAVLIAYFVRGKTPQKAESVLFVLIWCVLLSNLLEFAGIIVQKATGQYQDINQVLALLHFICRFISVILSVVYIVYITETASMLKSGSHALIASISFVGFILVLGNLRCGWLFSFNEQNQYQRGEYLIFYCLVILLLYLFCMIHLLHFGGSINFIRRISAIALLFFPAVAIVVQYIYPNVNMEGMGFSIGVLCAFLSIPKKSYIYDNALGVLNQYAFEHKVIITLKNKAEYALILLNVRNKNYILEQNGIEYYTNVLKVIISSFRKCVKGDELFYLGDGRFAVFTYQSDIKKNIRNTEKVIRRIKKELDMTEAGAEVKTGCILLEAHWDIFSLEDVYRYFEYLDINNIGTEDKVLLGEEIDITTVKRNETIENAIEIALQQENFEVYYQPIYSIKERKYVAAEALVRMVDENLGIVSPNEFLPVAEKNDRIIQIGELVLKQVCDFLSRVPVKDLGLRYIEVNMSAFECMEKNLSKRVDTILEKYHVDKTYLNFEITESAFAADTKALAENMYRLRKKGIMFTLDNYGTGHSNINYILNLPFKMVKIDKALLWQCIDSPKAMITLKALTNMFHDMGMETIVQGVETEEMVEMIKNEHGDYLQGYYFSEPLKEKEFVGFLKATNRS